MGVTHLTDDMDLSGHHLVDWRYLSDIPQGGATTGQVLTWNGTVWVPATVVDSGGGGVSSWNDLTDKPDTFPPDEHVHELHDLDATGEPTGFPNRTDSVITVDDATRSLTIAPVGDSFDVWIYGVKYTYTEPQVAIMDDTDGLWYFYFNGSGELVTTQTSTGFIELYASVAIAYWNAEDNLHVLCGDERHGCVMDKISHRYHHFTSGPQVESGLGLDGFVIGNGSLDTHAQFGVLDGVYWDEDIRHELTGTTAPASIPVLYLHDSHWHADTATTFPVKPAAGGITGLAYNKNTAGVWSQEAIDDGDYVLCHVFATNCIHTPYVAIQGQAVYATLPLAHAGAATEIASLRLTGLPTAEFVPVATVIFQSNTSYANAIDARIVQNENGEDYTNWVELPVTAAVGPLDHANLLNIGTTTHAQIDTYISEVARDVGIVITFDGGGTTIAVDKKGDYVVPFKMTITGWDLLVDQTSDIAIGVWKDTYANYPPLIGDVLVTPAITGGASLKAQATGLSLAVNANDILRFNVNSNGFAQRAMLALKGVHVG